MKEKKIIIVIMGIAVIATLLFPILSELQFYTINYTKFYKEFPLDTLYNLKYDLKPIHGLNTVFALTGIPLFFSIPSIDSYAAYLTEPYKSYGYSSIPFLVLKWVPWVSIPISYRFTQGITSRWRRTLYVYLIATNLGMLNVPMFFGGSPFDLFNL